MDEARDKEETIESLMKHILVVNFTNYLLIIQMWVFHVDASSVTHHVGVTQSFVHALFYLPTLSKYFASVHAEVEVAIKWESPFVNWKFQHDYGGNQAETTAATSVCHATYLLLLSVELISSFNVIPYTFPYFIIIVILYNYGIHLSSDWFSRSVHQVSKRGQGSKPCQGGQISWPVLLNSGCHLWDHKETQLSKNGQQKFNCFNCNNPTTPSLHLIPNSDVQGFANP